VPVPSPAIIAHKGNDDEINVNNFAIGDDHAIAIAEAIKYSNSDKIYLANNRITF